MHRCLISTEQIRAGQIVLGRDEARHLQTVLRIQPRDVVELFDGHGARRRAEVVEATRHGITFHPLEEVLLKPRPPARITLYACISKGKRMDWTIEKAVELGVSAVVPVISAHTIVRIDPREYASKRERWQRVADEAMRQCSSSWRCEIADPIPFKALLPTLTPGQNIYVAALCPGVRTLYEVLSEKGERIDRAGWFVGPEGDFQADELEALLAAGSIPVSLGPLILRAETACLYGLSVLNCFFLGRTSSC